MKFIRSLEPRLVLALFFIIGAAACMVGWKFGNHAPGLMVFTLALMIFAGSLIMKECQRYVSPYKSNQFMRIPTIGQVKALDGRIFATLSADEQAVLNFYRDRGRKYGVAVSILNEADPEELARASSRDQADEILKRSNSRVSVVVHQ